MRFMQMDVIDGVYRKDRKKGLWEFGAGKKLICCRAPLLYITIQYKCVTISNVLKRIS